MTRAIAAVQSVDTVAEKYSPGDEEMSSHTDDGRGTTMPAMSPISIQAHQIVTSTMPSPANATTSAAITENRLLFALGRSGLSAIVEPNLLASAIRLQARSAKARSPMRRARAATPPTAAAAVPTAWR